MSSITSTRGREWWLLETTPKGRAKYPDVIRVGKLYRERIYVPQRKCRKVPDGIDGSKVVCSKCSYGLDDGWNYCPSCGAKVVE